MRRLITIEGIVLIILAAAGILLTALDTLGIYELPTSLVPNATLAILSSITVFLFIQLSRLKRIDEQTTQLDRLNTKLSKLDIETIAQNIKDEHYGGLTVVHERLPEEELNKRLSTANNITLLNTWIPNLTSYIETLENALKRNANVQILLLYPYSDVAELRSEALRMSKNPLLGQSVKKGVEDCMEILRYIVNNVPEEKHGYLKVRLFNSLPSVSVYKTDDKMLVGVFFHGRLAIRSAQFDIEGDDSLLGRHIMEELSILWAAGQEIKDIRDWRTEIDVLSDKF